MADEQTKPSEGTSPSFGESFPRWLRVAVGALGMGLVGAGVAAVFVIREGAGAAALLAVGAVLIFFGLVGDRLESLKYGDLELVLRRKADEADRRGEAEEAETLRRAADAIGQRVAQIAGSYKAVRSKMPSGPDRTAQMEEIIAQVRNDAHAAVIDEEEVLCRLWTGSEGARVWALGVLQARPELATPRVVLEAVARPDQMFDQYHALVLAERFIAEPRTRPWTRERVQRAVRAQLDDGAFGTDRDCLLVAARILNEDLPHPSPSEPH